MPGEPRRGIFVVILAVVTASFLSVGASGQIEYDLAVNQPDAVIVGMQRFDYTGQAIGMGDFNADGKVDVVVTSFLADGPDGARIDAGGVRVVFGGPPEDERTPAAVVFHGPSAGARLGLATATADLDGDGVDDLVLTASGMAGPSGDRPEAGGAFVFLGRATPGLPFPPVVDLATTPADITFYGADRDDSFGGSFQFVPVAATDWNDDGNDDLVFGFPGGDGPDGTRADCGELHVFLGGSPLPPFVDFAVGASSVIYGEDPGDLLGVAVTSGDFNGDGIGDFVGGAKNADGPLDASSRVGEASGFFGRAAVLASVDLGAGGSDDFRVYGVDPTDRSSRALAAGDLNGDGIDDLVVGARHADGGSNGPEQESAGDAYVLPGAVGLSGEYFLEVDSALTVYGRNRNDSVGYTVGVADVDGDGYDDLVTGAQFADGPEGRRFRAGSVVVARGSAELGRVIDLRTDRPDLWFHGSAPQDSLGTGIASADLDGDGFEDLLLGATGRVYKQLDIPRLEDDIAGNIDRGRVFVMRGGDLLVRLGVESAMVPAGGDVALETVVANLSDSERSPVVVVRWLPPEGDPVVLKRKTVAFEADRRRRIPRGLPVPLDTEPGTYGIEVRLEEGGTGRLLDADSVFFEVLAP